MKVFQETGVKLKTKKYCLYCDKELIKRSQTKYCNASCQATHYYDLYIERWKQGLETGSKSTYCVSNHVQRYIREKYDNKCARCGWCEVNKTSGRIPLELEHIDGIYHHNQEENLILLCPNCHSLTPTYKGANKGKGRSFRKKYRLPV